MSDPIIPDAIPGLCHAEAKALIEAAQRVVKERDDQCSPYYLERIGEAIDDLADVLRHVTPEPADAKRFSSRHSAEGQWRDE